MTREIVSKEIEETEFINSSYCRLTKLSLTILGLWPYQNPVQRRYISSILFLYLGMTMFAQLSRIVLSITDIETVAEAASPCITALIGFSKALAVKVNSDKVKALQDQIDKHWKSSKPQEESKIIEKYLARGKLYSIGYAYYFYFAAFFFFLLTFEPKVLDALKPLNESRPLKAMYLAEYYFINDQDNFVLIVCHNILSCTVAVTMVIAADSLFIIFVQYACSMFAIAGHRFERIEGSKFLTETSKSQDTTYRVADSVFAHNQAILFLQEVQAIFSVCYFVVIVLNVVSLVFTLFEVLILLGHLEGVRFITYTIGQLFHLFCASYLGQEIINHSSETTYHIYNSMWYDLPNKTQKELVFALQRTAKPSIIAAGQMFTFSIETFSMVVQNSMSYFMVLASFR